MDKEININLIISQLNLLESHILMKKNLECITKSLKDSEAMRKSGNQLYFKKCNSKLLKKVFKLYTKSIAFAPCDSKELAIAYGNRSALLHRVKKYNESILDINRALAINEIDILCKLKLLCRKVECLTAQGSPNNKKICNEVESVLSKIIEPDSSTLKKIKKAKDLLSNLRKSDSQKIKEIPEHMKILSTKESQNPFDYVEVQYNKQFGRYLASTRDIKPGEIIFVEKSYLKFLEQDNFLNHCGHCFKKSWTNIPCNYCNWCMFCSEECKNLAWMNYHDIECTTVSYLRQYYKIDNSDHIGLRSLLMRKKELGSIAKFKADDLQFIDKFIDNHTKCMPVTKDMSLNTKLIKTGFTCDIVTMELLTKYAFTAAMILIILTKYTLFFEQSGEFHDISDLKRNDDVIFIGLIFLKLRIISENSSHIIHDENSVHKLSNDYMICKAPNCCSKGAYIPPISYSILHSCNPNTQLCVTDSQKLIAFALQPIKQNSPLLMAHHRWFFQSTEGNSNLRKIKSICHCEACTGKWPNMIQLYKMPKDKPDRYAELYNKKESNLYDENNPLVSPILNGKKFQFNQSTIWRLSKAMDVAFEYLKQPSIVICELMMCLNITFNRLYGADKLC